MLSLLFMLSTASAASPEWPDLSADLPRQGGGERDAALVVGIEDYAFVPDIPGARANADDWYLWLTRARGVPASRVRLLRDQEGTLEKMRRFAAEAADQVEDGGTLWFVFVGHGAPTRSGTDGMLIGSDAQQDADSLFARSLPQAEVLEVLGQGDQARTVAVIDSCFSGRTSRGEELVKGTQFVIPTHTAREVPGATVMTAGRADQFAGPLPGADRPAFSYLVLGALRGWGDEDSDGEVSAQEVGAYVNDALAMLVTDRTQTPEVRGLELDVPLAPSAEEGPDLTAMVLARPDGSELAFGGGVQVHVPTVSIDTSGSADLGDIDIEAEKLLDRALTLEDDPIASPTAKRDAWCALANRSGHAYEASAEEACSAWSTYVSDVERLAANLTRDYQTLAAYLDLNHKNADQKLAATDAFLDAYRHLEGDRRVKAVTKARDKLRSTGSARLAASKAEAPLPGQGPAENGVITYFGDHRGHTAFGLGMAYGYSLVDTHSLYGMPVFFEYGPLHLAAHANIVTASSQWQRVEISLEPGLTLLSWPRGDTVDQPSLVNPVVGPMLRLTASYLSDETEDSEPMAVGFYVGNMSYLAQGMAIRLDLSWPLIGGDSYAPLFSFGIMWTRRGN